MMKLEGKRAIVTGGNRGIGRAISEHLLELGAEVMITYHQEREQAETFVMDEAQKGAGIQCHQLDLADKDSIHHFRDSLHRDGSRIDILVNNAGINLPNSFNQIPEYDWDQVLDTNLKGVFLLCQKLEALINNDASIVNISSVSGQYGGPRTTHYCVSKAGLNALTQNMAIYFARRNIRVNAVSPGLIESEMAAAANSLNVDDQILLGRRGTPQEVAKLVGFLASADASYITAQVINVNGGLYF